MTSPRGGVVAKKPNRLGALAHPIEVKGSFGRAPGRLAPDDPTPVRKAVHSRQKAQQFRPEPLVQFYGSALGEKRSPLNCLTALAWGLLRPHALRRGVTLSAVSG